MICMFKVIRYCYLMYLTILEICALNYPNLILQDFFQFLPGLTWQAALEKTKVKLYLLTDIDTLLMAEKGMGGGICHSI